MHYAVDSPIKKVAGDNTTAPWQITLSAMMACLSLILMAVEALAENVSTRQSDLSRIAGALALEGSQAGEVDRILDETAELRSQALASSRGSSREQLRRALKSITENADNQLRRIFSADQFAGYVALRSEIRREALQQYMRNTRWNGSF